MANRVADDFEAIRQRLKELKKEEENTKNPPNPGGNPLGQEEAMDQMYDYGCNGVSVSTPEQVASGELPEYMRHYISEIMRVLYR